MKLNTVFGFTKTVNRRNRCNLSFSSLYFRSHHACMLRAFEPLSLKPLALIVFIK